MIEPLGNWDDVTWSSSNTDVFAVGSLGGGTGNQAIVRGVNPGVAWLRVNAGGIQAECIVRVRQTDFGPDDNRADLFPSEFEWPVPGHITVVRGFGTRLHPIEAERTGVDKAIAEALNTSLYGFLEGEFFTSAFRILRIVEDDASATVYLIASHGWYSRSSGLAPISGTGVIYGVLTLTREKDSYTVVEYREYDYKSLYPLGEAFPIGLVEYVQANTETLYAEMRADKERKVIEHFGL
jgi:hypothetical protein